MRNIINPTNTYAQQMESNPMLDVQYEHNNNDNTMTENRPRDIQGHIPAQVGFFFRKTELTFGGRGEDQPSGQSV